MTHYDVQIIEIPFGSFPFEGQSRDKKMKPSAFGLVMAGAVVMLQALFMNTAHNDVQNIGLLADRQIFLIFGGFLFLAGVILYTKSRSQKQSSVDSELSASETVQTQSIASKPLPKMLIALESWWASITLGEKVISLSAFVVLLSSLSHWFYIRTETGTSGTGQIYQVYYDQVGQGIGGIGFLLICLWIYPIHRIWQRQRIPFKRGVIYALCSLTFGTWYLVDILADSRNTDNFRELTGGDYISTGLGIWLFVLASIGFLVGVIFDHLNPDQDTDHNSLASE